MFMKKLASLLLALTLCASLALPALAAEGEKISADTGAISETRDETMNGAETAPESALRNAPEESPQEEKLPTITFEDIPEDHAFYSAIMDCAAKGITSGYADGTFRPTNSVTRAQFCVMLSRAFYPNEVKAHADAKTNWFSPNIQALSRAGILTGTSFTHAIESPSTMDQAISRYDMAQLMTNIMAAKGFSATSAQKTEAQKKIADYKSIPTQYQDAVKNVYALEIITGYSNGTFGGNNVMNRGQGCVVIYRMMQYTPATTPRGSGTGDAAYDDAKTPTTSTGNTENTNTQPKTPMANTLSNGKPITEANVLELLNELRTKYPEGTSFVDGYNINDVKASSLHVRNVTNAYNSAGGRKTSTTYGCGGWAAMVSDYIFGRTDFPARKVSIENVRPGDIEIQLDSNGNLRHVAIVASEPVYDTECDMWRWNTTDATDDRSTGRTVPYYVTWELSGGCWPDLIDQSAHFYTRYPS